MVASQPKRPLISPFWDPTSVARESPGGAGKKERQKERTKDRQTNRQKERKKGKKKKIKAKEKRKYERTN